MGFGMIAENFSRILQSFDVKLKIYSGYLSKEKAAQYNAELATLDEIFETCDIISVHSANIFLAIDLSFRQSERCKISFAFLFY